MQSHVRGDLAITQVILYLILEIKNLFLQEKIMYLACCMQRFTQQICVFPHFVRP